MGAVSTIEQSRWRNAPGVGRYVAALETGVRPPRQPEHLELDVRLRERVLLGLRLDEPLQLTGLEEALDPAGVERMRALGLADLAGGRGSATLALTRRGRFLGGGVTAELIA